MRSFSVAGGILHQLHPPTLTAGEGTAGPSGASDGSGGSDGSGAILLVCNKRRDGRIDWSPPGGIVDPGESVLEGLTREVMEETALSVAGWSDPLYSVTVDFVGRDYALNATVFEALSWSGDLHVDDPDGVVTDAAFVGPDRIGAHIKQAPRWVHEPLGTWLTERWTGQNRTFAYRAETRNKQFVVERIDP